MRIISTIFFLCLIVKSISGFSGTNDPEQNSDSYFITLGCSISATVSDTSMICFGDSIGFARITLTNADQPVAWMLDSVPVLATDTFVEFDSLHIGNYTVQFTDINGCTGTQTFTISSPAANISLEPCSSANPTCNGSTDGFVAAGSVRDPLGNVTYLWTNTTLDTIGSTPGISGLSAGVYTVVVSDDCGSASCTVTLTDPPAITMSACIVTDVTCNGDSDGVVTAGVITNSIGAVSYTWRDTSNSIIGNATSINGLPAGTYVLEVSDSCFTRTCTVEVDEPEILSMTACTTTDIACVGGNTGSVFSGTISNAVGTITYSWVDSNNVVVGNTASVDSLPEGVYTLTVTDQCTSLTCSANIIQSGMLDLAPCLHTDVSCKGGSNGSVTAGAVTNPTGSVTYSWTDTAGVVVGTTPSVSNLHGGIYTLTVTDDCGSVTCSQTINEPSGILTITACISTNISCTGGNSGSVSAGTITNSIGVIQYLWTDSNMVVVDTVAVVSNLGAGTYTLTVTDDCGSVTCTATISQDGGALSVSSVSHSDANCVGDSSGALYAGDIFNASGPVALIWRDSTTAIIGTTDTLYSLPAGVYTLTVQDGCDTLSFSQTISQPTTPLTVGTCLHTNVNCFGAATGTLTAGLVSNAVGSLTYSWSNSNNIVVGTTSSVTNQPEGTYTLTITDNCGSTTCTQTITQPAGPLTASSCTATDVSCNGDNNGTLSAGTILNSFGSLSYVWRNSNNVIVGTMANVSNMPADLYMLTVNDACGSTICMQTIAEPDALTMEPCSFTDVTCHGTMTGAISAGTITGGVGTLSYTWKNSNNVTIATTPNIANLAVGTYSLTVTDSCSTVICSQTINQPVPYSMTPCLFSDAGCYGSSTGSASSGVINGASGPVNYSWVDSNNIEIGTLPIIAGLAAGNYWLAVTTICGTLTCAVTISQFPQLEMAPCSHTDVCSGGSNGSVSAGTITGIVGIETYTWTDSNSVVIGNSPTIFNLAEGVYTLNVQDNCSVVTCTEEIVETDTIISFFSTTACDSYMLPWGGTATVSGDYSHMYAASSGCDSLVTAHVFVFHNSSSSYYDTAALSYVLPWGLTVTLSGSYSYIYPSSNGCDSTVTAHITIVPITGIDEVINTKDLFTISGSSLIPNNMISNPELFTIQGVSVGFSNLATGIYIFRGIYKGSIFICKIRM